MTPETTKPETIDQWLEQLGQPAADRDYKPGHERMHELLAPLSKTDNLKRPRLRIRIAGTNGKGSTAFMLSNALQACGLKVGLYTSPHILRFNERIRINGEPVSDATLLLLIESMMPTALKIGTSYFETATALALKHFSDSAVDVEVLEAGVGARLDATTAVEADVALITPIALDHQNWLGDTIESVADEKSYVADGCTMVLSAMQPEGLLPILLRRTPELELVEPDLNLTPAMPGDHQKQNAALALQAMKRLIAGSQIEGSMELAKQAIESTVVPGRLQKVPFGEATLWLDAAHNRHAVEALLPTLKELNLDSVFVFTREDRDLRECIPLFRQCAKRVVGEDGSVFDASYLTINDALANELGKRPSGNHLVLGSFLTVSAALEWIRKLSSI